VDFDITKSLRSHEYELSLYAYKKMARFTPYFGGKYIKISERLVFSFDDETGKILEEAKFSAKDRAGIFAGLNYDVDDNFTVNLEGGYKPDLFASVGLSYKF